MKKMLKVRVKARVKVRVKVRVAGRAVTKSGARYRASAKGTDFVLVMPRRVYSLKVTVGVRVGRGGLGLGG